MKFFGASNDMTNHVNDGNEEKQHPSDCSGDNPEKGAPKGRRKIIKAALAAAPLIVTVPARRAGATGSGEYDVSDS